MREKLHMNKLLKLQQKFQSALLGEKSDFIKSIVDTDELSGEERINLYADGYIGRLVEALEANYPKLRQYTSVEKFDQMSRTYIAKYPSTFHRIRNFGDKLPFFLQNQKSYKPVLAEIAKFEWAVGDTFDAIDSPILSIDDLKNISPQDWPNMRFNFHPSVRYQTFSYNVANIWDALLKDKTKRPILLKKPQKIMFWRQNFKTFYRQLSEMESYALEQALNGKTFAVICEGLCQCGLDEDVAGGEAAIILVQWLTNGIIIRP